MCMLVCMCSETVYYRVVPSIFKLLGLSQLSEAIKSVLNNLALAELILS